MKIRDVLDYVIELQEPAFSETVLLRWLNQVEAEIQTEVLLLAVDGIVQYSAEDIAEGSGTELIVPAPFSKLYEDYLLWRIALGQGEAERANNLETIYRESYLAYVRFVCGTIDPGSGKAEQLRYYLTAYQIAVKLGFDGSEEEWIASLKGEDGEIGAGLEITDQILTEEELPVLTNSMSDIGKAYMVGEGVDALLYIWNGTDWFYKQHLGTVGPPGADGVSPTIAVTEITGGHRLTITDKTGTKNVDIMDGEVGQTGATGQTGQTGATGEPGKDGVSPTITTAPITGGHRLTIKDAAGTKSIDLMNGKDGEDGGNGKDGVSPTISVSVISGGHRLTIKDATGTKTVDLLDGKAGEDGSDGSPGATGEKGADGVGIKNIVFKQNNTAGNVYTINLTDGSSYDFTAPVGPKGADGSGGTGGGGSGEDGVGIQSIQLKSEADTGNTYTIILTDGSTYDFVAPAGPSGKDGSNGEPGKDGTSVTVASVTESTEDGGSNVVKFSDGKTVTIKNGSKGSDGAAGKDGQDGSPGADGKDGENGTSVTVTNVSESNVDGGTNVVTFSDGKKLNIKNGSKGSDGAPGADGSPGAAGKDGVSPTIAVSAITGGNRLTITDANGSRNVDVMNGKDGKDGADGNDGSPGDAGPAGRGVQSMTYNSSTNKWTITYTDGTTSSVTGPAIPDVSGYMPKSGGTFTAAVYAMSGTGTAAQLRNEALVTTETYPSVNGQINWLCE
jgi:hypothetical protein